MNTIAIVTVCFNNLSELQETCISVEGQEHLPVEHWIIDGSSKQDIKQWFQNTQQPLYRKIISEKDQGIADAFNKGIRKSNSDIIYLLNSGDAFYDNTVLIKVAQVFEKNPHVMWCHGKMKMQRGGIWVIVGKPFDKRKLYRGMRGVFHPTMYVRREVYDRKGLYDIQVKMAMDYDFLCRIANEAFAFIDYPLATFDPYGISSSRYIAAMKESFSCYQKYYGKTLKQTLWGWRLTVLHFILRSGPGKWLYKMKVAMKMENW